MIAYFKPDKARQRPVCEPTEFLEQCAVIQWATLQASRRMQLRHLFAIPNASGLSGGFKRNGRRIAALLRMGMQPGAPDLFLAWPRTPWHGLFIEMKRADGTVTAEQKAVAADRSSAGYAVAFAFGAEQAQRAILTYLAGEYPYGLPP